MVIKMTKTLPENKIHLQKKRKKYHQLPWVERGLDLSLLIGFVIGLLVVILDLFFHFSQRFSTYIYIFDVVFVSIVFMDMSRTFLKSKNIWHFFKHHWLDTVILTFCIVSFSSVLYAGIGRFSWLLREERVIMEAEELLPVRLLRKVRFIK